jgi:hypothetical protein
MVRSTFMCAACVAGPAFAVAGSLAACGSGGSSQAQGTPVVPVGVDGGLRPDAAGAEGGFDAGVETGSETAAPAAEGGVACIEGGAGPKGTQLVQSSTASVLGLTDDDEIVYVETRSRSLFAVSASGGAPASLGPTASGSASVRIASKSVLNWTGLNSDGSVSSSLQLWTPSNGLQTIAGASLVGAADSNRAGTRVIYFDNATASTADLFVAGTDGSAKTNLASVIPWSATCVPLVSFVGDAVLLGYCDGTPPASGAKPIGTLCLFVGTSGQSTTLSTTADLSSVQSSGTSILFAASDGLTAANTVTGETSIVDSAAGTSASLTGDGQSVVYVASDGSIKRSPLASPSPTTLVAPGGFQTVSVLSPDNAWVLASKTSDPNTGNSDIYLASATTPGPASTILATPTGAIYGSAFTADSSRVLYVDQTQNGAGVYHAAPTAGGRPAQVATDMWIGFATTGARVLFNDGFVPQVGLQGQGIANIESADLSASPITPTLLVNQADPGFFFTSAGDRVVYSTTFCATGSQGIWIMATP